MRWFLFFFISLPALGDPLFTKVTYYRGMGGVGDLFRVETASNWPKCREVKRAQKIFLDKTNELREIAYWDEKGEMHGAGKSNNPHVHKKAQGIFSQSRTSGNPCEVPESTETKKTEPEKSETKSSESFEQIELGGPQTEPISTDPTLH